MSISLKFSTMTIRLCWKRW